MRNRLLALGALWGALLAVIPALFMVRPYRLSGFLIASVLCAVASGSIGTLAAGRRAAASHSKRRWLVAGLATGLFQGLVGGGIAALLIWVLMAVTLSGFTLENPVELSTLMSPRVFLGSFFVSLSVFLYAVAGGLVLSPAFGTLIGRAVRVGEVES